MVPINVTEVNKDDQGWDYEVRLGSGGDTMDYSVRLDEPYYIDITNRGIDPEVLVKLSFEFLLEREPKEMIMRNFNLRIIQNYFNEYEGVARTWAGA